MSEINQIMLKACSSLNLFLKGNLLIGVPGGSDGPSGVIVCCENYLVYKNLGDQPDVRCPIPRRRVIFFNFSCLFLIFITKILLNFF